MASIRPVPAAHPAPISPRARLVAVQLLLASIGSACVVTDGDDDDGAGDDTSAGQPAEDDGSSTAPDEGSSESGNVEAVDYAVASLAFGTDETSLYVSLVEALDGQRIDFASSREFVGSGDLWIHDGAVFVAETSSLTITKFSVTDGALVETGKISFANYGLTDLGFWLNSFVSPTKAYLVNGSTEHIVWNPSTMEITGTVALPSFAEREGFMPFPSYSDRSAVVRDGLLYQPIYFTDESYFLYTPESEILVLDTETDTFLPSIVADCPGLDFASTDANGDIVFSNWVYASGGAAFLDQPATCVARVASGSSSAATVDFAFADITDGRQGSGFQFTGGGKALFAVLHEERVEGDAPDPSEATFGSNWRFWSYDATSASATMIDAIDWNAGAAYWARVDDRAHMLVPSGDYTSTTIFDVSDPAAPQDVLQTDGWSLRLFEIE